MEVSIGETSEVVEQSDGSYKLTYDVGSTFSLGGQKITVKVQTKGGNPAWLENSYSYGDLLGMIEFYDAENLVFYDGASYADHCQLKLIKTVGVPTIQTSMTAPDYDKTYNGVATDMFIPLLAKEYNTLGADNQDFVALSDTIRILEGARNSVRLSGSTENFISHTKSTPASSLTGLPAFPILALRRMAIIVVDPHNPMPRSV